MSAVGARRGVDAGSGGRRPGRPRVLSDAEIVDAALTVARERGTAGLSMRAVARQLGVPPMTIYGYVPNKAALETLVLDRILGEVRVPGPGEGPWQERLRTMLCDARRTLSERPELPEGSSAPAGSAVALLHRGAFGAEASRLAAGVLDLLREGCFGPEDLDVCFGALFTYVTGHVDPTGDDATRRAAGDRTVASRSSEEIFALGLEALIEGLTTRVGTRPLRPAPGPPRRG